MSKENYKSNLAFIDLLFNLLIGICFLFVLAFIMINPITKTGDVPKKAEYIITMSWPKDLTDDIDLWVLTPLGDHIGFANRETKLINYERDDLGASTDSVKVDGKTINLKINKETIVIRGIIPGQYRVSAHYYSNGKNTEPPLPVQVQLIKMNPKYSIVFSKTMEMNNRGDILDFFRFKINPDGNVVDIGKSLESAVPKTVRGRYQ